MTDTKRSGRRAKGEGSVFWNEDKQRWHGMIDLGYGNDGRRDRKKVSAKTKTEVVKRLAELRRQVDGGVNLLTADQTVGSYIDSWAASLSATSSLRPTTIESYRWLLKKYVTKELRSVPMRKLTPQRIRSWMTELASPERERQLSARTINLARVVVGAALKQAQRDGLILTNPMDAVDGPSSRDRGEPKALTGEQASKLLASSVGDPVADAFIGLALGCGLRRGEILGLQWDDLTLDTKPPILTVRRAIASLGGTSTVQAPKTRSGRRQVIIPEFAVKRLRAWKTVQIKDRLVAGPAWRTNEPLWVLTSSIGTALDPNNHSKRIVALGKTAGLALSPHALRHTYVTLALNAGAPIGIISKSAGHSSISVTSDIYGSLQTEGQALIASAISRAIQTDDFH